MSGQSLQQPDKILVILVAGIGDFIVAIPSLKGLRNHFPASRIVLLTSDRAYPYAAGCPLVDKVLPFKIPVRSLKESWRCWKSVLQLRREHFALVINLYEIGRWIGGLKMFFLFRFLHGKWSVGRDTEGRGFFFDLRVKEGERDLKSQGDYYEEIVTALGGRVDFRDKSALWYSQEAQGNVEVFFRENRLLPEDLLMGINPGGMRKTRHWFGDRFARVADRLIEKYQARVIIVGSPEEKPLAEEIAGLMKNKAVVAAGRTSFEEAILLVKKMHLLVTTNSSLMHVANAVGTPFVALIGADDIIKDGPYQAETKKYLPIQKKVACSPCYRDVCRKMECMKRIESDDVLKAAEELLKANTRY